MIQGIKQKALNEAIRIGEEILAKAERDENGLFWKNLNFNFRTKEVSKSISEDLYRGVSGIALFFAELYVATNNKKFLTAATEAMKWVHYQSIHKSSNFYALYTGKMGVSFTLLRLFEITNNKIYKKQALEVARNCAIFLQNRHCDDLLNGTAGVLLGLIHLHSHTKEKWVLNEIINFTKDLISKASPGIKGLYWDRSGKNTHGLCGFSHGAAGIGFAFLELGKYFNNKVFYAIAEEAFAYENYYWNKKMGNWPDFRKDGLDELDISKYTKAYEENDFDYFIKEEEMNAWCHGAAGIGLSRLRAWELLKNKRYKTDITRAIKKTAYTECERSIPNPSFILCHAAGGNAELFIETLELLGDKKCNAYINKVIERLFAYRNTGKPYRTGFPIEDLSAEDIGLFMGNAGIGYFLLRSSSPKKFPSILAPSVNKKNTEKISDNYFSQASVNKILLEKQYPQTICLLENVAPSAFSSFVKQEHSFSNKKAFPQFIKFLKKTLKPAYYLRITDIYKLESRKVSIENANTSRSLLLFREAYEDWRTKKTLLQGDENFYSQTLILSPACSLTTTKWDWTSPSKKEWLTNLSLKSQPQVLLLKELQYNISMERLTAIDTLIINTFKLPTVVTNAIKIMIKQFQISNNEDELTIKNQLYNQIKQLSLKGTLLLNNGPK